MKTDFSRRSKMNKISKKEVLQVPPFRFSATF